MSGKKKEEKEEKMTQHKRKTVADLWQIWGL